MRPLKLFGKTQNGEDVNLISLKAGDICASFLSWGAVLQDLRIASRDYSLVLGFDNFDEYFHHSRYFGATVGRCANRIAGGKFKIEGETFQTELNEKGINTLHGANALSHSVWDIVGYDDRSVEMSIVDADGSFGFPGCVTINAKFELLEDGTLRIEYSATTDKPTVVNLAHHSYFNLAGSGDILSHQVQILAEHYLPVDGSLIPTGEIVPVLNTPFDFTSPRTVASAGAGFLHDHNYCLNGNEGEFRKIAEVFDPSSGVTMQVRSDQKGVQFYTAKGLETSVAGLNGEKYSAYAGMCLEAQKWPDGINRDGFPEMILQPGQTYSQITEYQFSSE